VVGSDFSCCASSAEHNISFSVSVPVKLKKEVINGGTIEVGRVGTAVERGGSYVLLPPLLYCHFQWADLFQ
jgi:hypothetical protein